MLGSAAPHLALVASTLIASATAPPRPVAAAPPSSYAASTAVTLIANDFAFSGMPSQIAAGWVTIRLVNHGHELHMLATANVPKGSTASSMIDAVLHGGHLPDDVREWGGPNAVAPGDTGTVILYLPAGDYLLGCFVESADGKTHFAKGMAGSVHVVQAKAKGATPISAHDVTLSTYAIAMTGPAIHTGLDTLRVHNAARERHDLVVLRVAPGHSVADALAWFTNPPTGAPAAVAVAGTTGIHTGEDAFISGHFTPGTYVLVCWMYTNGKVHHQLGMKHVFAVSAS